MPMRLYVSGSGETFRFVTAKNMMSARRKIGVGARTPNADDCRRVWLQGKIYELSEAELQKKYHVGRQTAAQWRYKGGEDLPTASEHKMRTKVEAVYAALTSMSKPSALAVADAANTSAKLARIMAEKMGVPLRSRRRMPSDEELIELQRGCTWQELAIKTGLRLCTLRSYIYARPELSDAMRAVRKPTITGQEAHGSFPREKVRELYLTGASAHLIAETLHVEQMTVRYWINKWKKEAADEKSRDGREAGSAVGGSDEWYQREQG